MKCLKHIFQQLYISVYICFPSSVFFTLSRFYSTELDNIIRKRWWLHLNKQNHNDFLLFLNRCTRCTILLLRIFALLILITIHQFIIILSQLTKFNKFIINTKQLMNALPYIYIYKKKIIVSVTYWVEPLNHRSINSHLKYFSRTESFSQNILNYFNVLHW